MDPIVKLASKGKVRLMQKQWYSGSTEDFAMRVSYCGFDNYTNNILRCYTYKYQYWSNCTCICYFDTNEFQPVAVQQNEESPMR